MTPDIPFLFFLRKVFVSNVITVNAVIIIDIMIIILLLAILIAKERKKEKKIHQN